MFIVAPLNLSDNSPIIRTSSAVKYTRRDNAEVDCQKCRPDTCHIGGQASDHCLDVDEEKGAF